MASTDTAADPEAEVPALRARKKCELERLQVRVAALEHTLAALGVGRPSPQLGLALQAKLRDPLLKRLKKRPLYLPTGRGLHKPDISFEVPCVLRELEELAHVRGIHVSNGLAPRSRWTCDRQLHSPRCVLEVCGLAAHLMDAAMVQSFSR